MTNITQVLREERNMATMNTGIIASGLDQLLGQEGPFTVFVPSDLAFGKLEQGIFPNLLLGENKALLADILAHHIVRGKVSFNELKDGAILTTVQGRELQVRVLAGTVTINGATVQNRDVAASNGVIHSLNAVLLN
jgi:uncharacterized surface protein with fasciclin (FAS1) repeats